MTVVNYSVQDIFDVNTRIFVGLDWYRETRARPQVPDALLRQLSFSALVLVLESPSASGLPAPFLGRGGKPRSF